jgi:cell wall-associated NlpC family hydrolase
MARRSFARRVLVAGTVICFARWATAQQGKTKPAPPELPDDAPEAAVAPTAAPSRALRKRLATSLVFATLFFAGAAFTAGAGNELAAQVDAASTDPAAAAADVPVPSATDTVAADPAPTVTETVTVPAPSSPAPADPAATAPAPAAATDTGDAIVVTSSTPAEPAPGNVSVATTAATAAPAARTASHPAKARRARRAIATTHAAPAVVAPLAPIPFAAITFQPKVWLHDNPASTTGASAAAIAMHYLGVPYVWGGAIPATGFDCSGLTRFVYAQLGVNLPHYAASQFAEFTKLDPSQLAPGDLVFFEPKFDGPGHVALYIGDDQMIEAPHTGALVRISSFSGAAAAMGFLGAVRPYATVVPQPVPYVDPLLLRFE